MSQVVEDTLKAGREAIERHAWREAVEHLTAADQAEGLSPEDLEGLAEAAWWTGHLEDSIEARERAYAAYAESGDWPRAAFVALELASNYSQKLASSLAAGWRNRAERVLEGETESVEHGYLAMAEVNRALSGGELERAFEWAERATEMGSRFGDRDLQARGIMAQGSVLVAQGQVSEGMDLIDEASAAAVSGELGPMATAIIYCNTITTCRDLGDIQRAGDWTDAAKRWCQRQDISGFPGVCRVYRAEIMRLRGAWSEAEREARRASDELRDFNLPAAGGAFREIGEIRLRVGDLAGAEDAFRQAHELGHDPQPGLALLRLAEGTGKAAAASIKRALADESWDPLARARLLPAQVEIAIANGDFDTARLAADDLQSIAGSYESSALEASADYCRGALQIAEGNAGEAVARLRGAWHSWQEMNCPYEAGRARMLLGAAYWAEGEREVAVMEVEAAQAAFERLGALPDARRAAALLETAGKAAGRPVPRVAPRVAKTFMFTDIVRSTDLVEAIGDEAWKDLLGWHDRTLRSLLAEHGGEEIDHTGDGFFVAFADAGTALECAVAIQRRLAEHRRNQGFSPQVRIGLHAATATQRGHDYAGKGVHQAQRITALAEGEEILASADTLEGIPMRFPTSHSRAVRVKGIRDEVEVLTIEWR